MRKRETERARQVGSVGVEARRRKRAKKEQEGHTDVSQATGKKGKGKRFLFAWAGDERKEGHSKKAAIISKEWRFFLGIQTSMHCSALLLYRIFLLHFLRNEQKVFQREKRDFWNNGGNEKREGVAGFPCSQRCLKRQTDISDPLLSSSSSFSQAAVQTYIGKSKITYSLKSTVLTLGYTFLPSLVNVPCLTTIIFEYVSFASSLNVSGPNSA